MNKYQDTIYGGYKKSNYPKKLVKYILENVIYPSSTLSDYKLSYTILDLGCGDRTYTNLFKNQYTEVKGIDSEIDLDKDKIPFENDTFDIIFTKSVIEHIYHTEHFLKEAHRVLKKGGRIIVLTPAWEFNYRWFYDDPTHVRPFHRKGLQDALRMKEFKIEKLDYFYHLPIFWKYPELKFLAKITRLLPDDWRWKDWGQQDMNIWIRFCKEVQLLAVGVK